MDDFDNEKQPDHVFRAVLTPHRSLSRTGFIVLMVAIGALSFGIGMYFLSLGAWPVMGFFGLDVALIYLAFRLNYWSGRAYEVVDLSPRVLTVTRVDPAGNAQAYEFNPYWARVKLSEWPDGRTVMWLAARGETLVFGRFLNNEERREFFTVFESALAEARTARL